MARDLRKTFSYLGIHLIIGFTVAYLFTGSVAIAGGIALVEPLRNAVAYFFHERAWHDKAGMPGGNWASGLMKSIGHRHTASSDA